MGITTVLTLKGTTIRDAGPWARNSIHSALDILSVRCSEHSNGTAQHASEYASEGTKFIGLARGELLVDGW